MPHPRSTFRLLRRCFYAALIAAFLALQIRGHWIVEGFNSPSMCPQFQAINEPGHIELLLVWYPPWVDPGWAIGQYWNDGDPVWDWRPGRWIGEDRQAHFEDEIQSQTSLPGILLRSGLRSTSGSESPRMDAPWASILFPTWLPAALAALPLLLALYRRLRRQPLPQSACPTCSYDLRAHSPGQKCPECGTPIPPSKSATITTDRSSP